MVTAAFSFGSPQSLVIRREPSSSVLLKEHHPRRHRRRPFPHRMSTNEDDQEPSKDELVLGEAVDQQMARLRSKYPTSEADYLAAARARAAAKTASVESSAASDSDWQRLADEKRQAVGGEIDDWENAKAEAGNADSQILLPDLPTEDGDGEDGEDPKLLLF